MDGWMDTWMDGWMDGKPTDSCTHRTSVHGSSLRGAGIHEGEIPVPSLPPPVPQALEGGLLPGAGAATILEGEAVACWTVGQAGRAGLGAGLAGSLAADLRRRSV